MLRCRRSLPLTALVAVVAGLLATPVLRTTADHGSENTVATPGPAAGCLVVAPAEDQVTTTPARLPARVIPRVAKLSPDDASLVLEQIALRQLAEDSGLVLSDADWTTLAAIVAELQAARQAYEATIATVIARQEQTYRVVVPAYPQAGDQLRTLLEAELGSQLGVETAVTVMEKLGSALERHFAGFGVSAQTLDFSPDSSEANRFWVQRTATFWDSQVDGEKLVTRREVLLPHVEDPTGLRWAPFLALLTATPTPST